jgi:hypothetical protein
MNQQLSSSTTSFLKLIIKKINKVGCQIICISWKWHWLRSQYNSKFGKLTCDMCNLPYSEKPFISRIDLSLMDRLWLSVSGIEDCHHFTDRYCTVFGVFNLTMSLLTTNCGVYKSITTSDIKCTMLGHWWMPIVLVKLLNTPLNWLHSFYLRLHASSLQSFFTLSSDPLMSRLGAVFWCLLSL